MVCLLKHPELSPFVYFIERTKEEKEEDFHEIEVHENQSTVAAEISNSQVMVYLELLVACTSLCF